MAKIGESEKRNLEVLLNDVEVSCYADKLARVIHELGDVEAEKKTVMKAFSAQISAIEKALVALAVKVETKKEMREVACFWDLHANGQTKSLIRSDTHEIVMTEVATDADRQEALFGKVPE